VRANRKQDDKHSPGQDEVPPVHVEKDLEMDEMRVVAEELHGRLNFLASWWQLMFTISMSQNSQIMLEHTTRRFIRQKQVEGRLFGDELLKAILAVIVKFVFHWSELSYKRLGELNYLF
jgi:hypothetical protein